MIYRRASTLQIAFGGAVVAIASAQPLIHEDYKLLPHDGGREDFFGYSTSISNGIAIVGAYGGPDELLFGAAYLYDTLTGEQIAKLVASDGSSSDRFGRSVAIAGSTAVVGAWGDDDNGAQSGSAYLFDVATGQQLAKLLPDDGEADDRFGYSVAMSDDYVVISSPASDDNGPNSGSVYLFDRSTGRQAAKLFPLDATTEDRFGWAVAISGDTIIVGARRKNEAGTAIGAAYLFDVPSLSDCKARARPKRNRCTFRLIRGHFRDNFDCWIVP